MPNRFQFDGEVLKTLVGGQSALDMSKLNFLNLDEVNSFLKVYGFDYENPVDQTKLWYFHRRALVLLIDKLKFNEDEIPAEFRDPKKLGDLRNLLLWASGNDPRESLRQKWACAFLRTMHVFVHAENDLFAHYSEEIQKQILSPVQDCVVHDGARQAIFLRKRDLAEKDGPDHQEIKLAGFDIKPFKTSSSTVIKLLAKPDALAMNVFDKIGIRIIADSMFDCYRVIRFLSEQNLVSFPHIMPDQSSNNLYPVDLFLKASRALEAISKMLTDEEVDQYYQDYLADNMKSDEVLRKHNKYSGDDYRFIKFISRRLIKISTGNDRAASNSSNGFSFFYPFEVQIMDRKSYQSIQNGPSEHQAYKERQRLAAAKRIFHVPAPGSDGVLR